MRNKLNYIIEESVRLGWLQNGINKHTISDIIFNHERAKVVYGEEEVCERCGKEDDYAKNHKYCGDYYQTNEAYLYHLTQLSQLETDEERVDYEFSYLKERNK